jgi:16S rRNA G966 N2-methylase RsmD
VLVDSYTRDERAKDWLSLEKKVVFENGDVIPIDTRTRPGHKILDHFMTHFYDVKNYKGVSVRDLFTQESLEKALMQNIQMHSTPYVSEIRRMIVMTGGLGSVTKYRTVTSKAIVQFFGAKRVLDPCCGWGGRMLGTLAAAKDTGYVACEPDPNTFKGLKGILEDTAIPLAVRSRARVLEKPAELGLSELLSLEKFDLVLTSPPYFNLELYTAGDQSTTVHKTWEDWTEKWLKPVILGCLACLKEGGVSCWSVKDFKSDKKYPLAEVTKKIHKDAGWVLVKTVTMTGSGRPGGKRIEEGKEKRESEEETFCFRRAS